MLTPEQIKLKEARANYVKALRNFEGKHRLIVESLKIRRQTFVNCQSKSVHTMIVGIGEKEIDRNEFLSKRTIEANEVQNANLNKDFTLIFDNYEEDA